MNRILKENATVPLFFAQTLIASLRDVGYNSTTSALCEHVDNAIETGAREIRIYFRQRGVNGRYDIDAAVYDGGRGMSPNGSGGNCMGMAMMILQRPQGATSGGSVSHHHWHGGLAILQGHARMPLPEPRLCQNGGQNDFRAVERAIEASEEPLDPGGDPPCQ